MPNFDTFLSVFLIIVYAKAQNQCCHENFDKNLTGNDCKILNCSHGDVYLLDPVANQEDFFLVDNETNLVFNNGTSQLPPSQ